MRTARRVCFPAVIALLTFGTPRQSVAQDTGNPYWEAAKYGYEAAKWYYEKYKAAEAARTEISLEANARPEVVPDQNLRVSEDAKCRLPNVKATTSITWVPFAELETRITAEWVINNVSLGRNTHSFRGRPSKREWERWYPERGPYPYAGRFSNDNKTITFDMVSDGEAFETGVNTISVRLWGTTHIEKNFWNPANWLSLERVEKVAFPEIITQDKDLEVQVPYRVRKVPNVPIIEQQHQLNATVQLWDTNLALSTRGGNRQRYQMPTVRVVHADGDLPPDDGTTNNERLVAQDQRIHPDPNHPDKVHVPPDFDPIKVDVMHREWTLPELAGRVYRKPLNFPPTKPYCVGTGVPDSTPPGLVPPEETNSSSWAVPDFDLQYRTVVDGDPLAGVPSTTVVFAQDTTGTYQPLDTLRCDVAGDLYAARHLPAGRSYQLDISYRDQFGRRFTSVVNTSTTRDSINPAPLLDLGTLSLSQTSQESVPEPTHEVKVAVCDIAGLAFGRTVPVAGIAVHCDFSGGSQEVVTGQAGEATFTIPDGQSMAISTAGSSSYLPLSGLPTTPPIYKPLGVSGTGGDIQDDRILLLISPAFASGRVFPVVAWVQPTPMHGDSLAVQAVTDIPLTDVTQIDLFVAGTTSQVGSALPLPWGQAGQRFPYQPLKIEFGSSISSAMRDSLLQSGLELVFRSSPSDIHAVLQLAIATGVDDHPVSGRSPSRNALGQNRPNPFNPHTLIPYRLAQQGRVVIRIYDITGRLVRTLVDGVREPGDHTARWFGERDDGLEAAGGVYYYQITYPNGERSAKRMTVVR